MTVFEALYSSGCRSPVGLFEVGDVKPMGVDLVKDSQNKVRSIKLRFYHPRVGRRSMWTIS